MVHIIVDLPIVEAVGKLRCPSTQRRKKQLRFGVERLPSSYSEKRPKLSSKEIPFFTQALKESNNPNLLLSNEVFQTEANFHDWRDTVPVYYKMFFEYDNKEQCRASCDGSVGNFHFNKGLSWVLSVPQHLHKTNAYQLYIIRNTVI
ncbi:unnamed protein product [Ambrosiozyma monospora]|uniref:Unnamed protein product n=1 Tax=Ambrosiozyma monospora TaxID=43982 RepID=A0ACB5U0D1_AMBMO|nr:unnamed protein product [Ambrosiozyma monospora]